MRSYQSSLSRGAEHGAVAFMALLLVLGAGLAGCGTDSVSATTGPQSIALSGAVTGMITSAGSCPANSQAFSSSWTATLGGAQYTLTVAVDDTHPTGMYDLGVANGFGARVTLAKVGASTIYDSNALHSEDAGRISVSVTTDETWGTLDSTLKDASSGATVRATGSWTCTI